MFPWLERFICGSYHISFKEFLKLKAVTLLYQNGDMWELEFYAPRLTILIYRFARGTIDFIRGAALQTFTTDDESIDQLINLATPPARQGIDRERLKKDWVLEMIDLLDRYDLLADYGSKRLWIRNNDVNLNDFGVMGDTSGSTLMLHGINCSMRVTREEAITELHEKIDDELAINRAREAVEEYMSTVTDPNEIVLDLLGVVRAQELIRKAGYR